MQHHFLQEPAFFAGFLICLILITAALLLLLIFAPLTAAEGQPRIRTERRRWRPLRSQTPRQPDASGFGTAWDEQNRCPRAPR